MVDQSNKPLSVPVLVKRNDTVDRPRILTRDDLDWLHYICRKRYDHKYDPVGTESWFVNEVMAKPILYFPVRSDDAFLISMITTLPWTPTVFCCDQVFACADSNKMWQLVGLLRRSVAWAKRRNCTEWRVSSDTLYDFRPLAKRFGAEELQGRWILRLRPPDA